jgi:deoxyhypusine synthase
LDVCRSRKEFTNNLYQWEDSTMGNIFASYVIKGDLSIYNEIRNRVHGVLIRLVSKKTVLTELDFSKLVVVLLEIFQSVWFQCLPRYGNARHSFWSFSVKFQIQLPVMVRILELFRMKNTWGKLDIKTPNLLLNLMLAPLIFAYLLDL